MLPATFYVADYEITRSERSTSTGVVTTWAGNSILSGSTDGTGTAASFLWPVWYKVDSSGNLYVADATTTGFGKNNSSGAVDDLAGNSARGSTDGTSTAASFYGPSGVAIDVSGNLYVADASNNKIRK